MRRYGIKIINERPRTPRTQGLIKQANGSVKNKINSWKRDHGSSHWADALKVCYSIFSFFFLYLLRISIFSAKQYQYIPNWPVFLRAAHPKGVYQGQIIKFMVGENWMLTYFFQEIALQLNSTYHKAIKAIPYEVVYNRKPNYKRTPIGRNILSMDLKYPWVECNIDRPTDVLQR